MIFIKNQSIFNLLFILSLNLAHGATVKAPFTSKLNSELSEPDTLEVRVPRETSDPLKKSKDLDAAESLKLLIDNSEKFIRKARDSKYYSENYGSKSGGRTLKPEDNLEENRDVKGSGTTLGKRCTTCDNGYLGSLGGSTYSRGQDRYDRNYERDPYSNRYDRYDRYDRDRYYDRYDDYDRDGSRDYRGRNRYPSSYDRYDPRDRYYDRGIGSDNRGYNYRDYYRDDYYSPYYRDRYDPYDDYYSRGSGYDSRGSGYDSRGSGYDSLSRGGGTGGGGGYYSSRPDNYGGYARGYSYGDRDRYGGSGSGNGYSSGGGGYGSGYGGYGSYGGSQGANSGVGYGTSGYGSYYGGSRSRTPSYDYDSGYRGTSYLYGRPSSTTTDMPKNSDGDSNTASPSQINSSGRSK